MRRFKAREVYTPDDVNCDRERQEVEFESAAADDLQLVKAAMAALGWGEANIAARHNEIAEQPGDEQLSVSQFKVLEVALAGDSGDYVIVVEAAEHSSSGVRP